MDPSPIRWAAHFDLAPTSNDPAILVLVHKQGRRAGHEVNPSHDYVVLPRRVLARSGRRVPRPVPRIKKAQVIWEMRNGPPPAGHKIIQLATGDTNRPQLSELRCVPESHPTPKRSPRWKAKPNTGDTP